MRGGERDGVGGGEKAKHMEGIQIYYSGSSA